MAGMYYDLFIVNFKMLYIREKGRHILLKWLFLTPEGNIQLKKANQQTKCDVDLTFEHDVKF